jgi:hypothetical protein
VTLGVGRDRERQMAPARRVDSTAMPGKNWASGWMAREWRGAMMIEGRRMACAAVRMDRAEDDLLREEAVLDLAMVDRKVRRHLRGVTFIDRVRKDSVVDHRHLRGAIIGTTAMADRILLVAMVPTDPEPTISADRQVAMVCVTGRASQDRIEMAVVRVAIAMALGPVDLAAAQDR